MCSLNKLSSTQKSQFYRPCMRVFDSLMFNFCSSLLHSNLPCWFLPGSGQTDLDKPKITSATHSLINFPAIVSHDYSVISLALNNIFCPTKLSIQRVYVAVARFDSRQQLNINFVRLQKNELLRFSLLHEP